MPHPNARTTVKLVMLTLLLSLTSLSTARAETTYKPATVTAPAFGATLESGWDGPILLDSRGAAPGDYTVHLTHMTGSAEPQTHVVYAEGGTHAVTLDTPLTISGAYRIWLTGPESQDVSTFEIVNGETPANGDVGSVITSPENGQTVSSGFRGPVNIAFPATEKMYGYELQIEKLQGASNATGGYWWRDHVYANGGTRAFAPQKMTQAGTYSIEVRSSAGLYEQALIEVIPTVPARMSRPKLIKLAPRVVKVRWPLRTNDGDFNGGARITAYQVKDKITGRVMTVDEMARSATFRRLSWGRHVFISRALNKVGPGRWSEPARILLTRG